VNAPGRKAILAGAAPKYPAGTVIVKEKLTERDSRTPDLMTVMIKRKKGALPATGDWEYRVLLPSGAPDPAAKLDRCSSCHLKAREQDYVFRDYPRIAEKR
jgi:hypothetical protein